MAKLRFCFYLEYREQVWDFFADCCKHCSFKEKPKACKRQITQKPKVKVSAQNFLCLIFTKKCRHAGLVVLTENRHRNSGEMQILESDIVNTHIRTKPEILHGKSARILHGSRRLSLPGFHIKLIFEVPWAMSISCYNKSWPSSNPQSALAPLRIPETSKEIKMSNSTIKSLRTAIFFINVQKNCAPANSWICIRKSVKLLWFNLTFLIW